MAKRKPVKTASKTASRKLAKLPAKITQPNGKGALYAGGVPGNAGGTGRPKSEVRAAALAGADKAIPKLVAIVEAEESETSEITAAAKVLLQFGLGTQTEVSVEDVKYRWAKTLAEMQKAVENGECTEAFMMTLLARIRPIWT